MSSTRQLELHMPPETGGAPPATPQGVLSTAFTAVSTGAIDTGIDAGNAQCTKNLVTFVTTQDCLIAFGKSDMAAATAADWLLKAADGPVTFLLDSKKTRFFRVIRSTADGTLRSYVSG